MMWIQEAARAAGVNPQTLRYYEQRGLIRPVSRRESGYREYTGEHVRLVRFVKRAQDLGFSLGDVAELLKLRDVGRARPGVRRVAERQLHALEQKIHDLTRMKHALAGLVRACHAGTDPRCPILEALESHAEVRHGRS